MNFMEAIEAMKQGKKVRLIQHRTVLPWVYKDRQFQIVEGNNIFPGKFDLLHFEGMWEVVEEKRTLWDKVWEYDDSDKLFSAVNVKEALKEFLIKSKDITDGKYDFYWLAKEIFGKEMLE